MYSIGEFSKICGMTVKTLRFYHERGVLVPASVDSHSGYRSYDERNLEAAYVIRELRTLEFSLDEIAIIVAECSEDQDLIEYLEQHKDVLAAKLRHYQDLVLKIDQVITHEQEVRKGVEMRTQSFVVEEHRLEPQLVAGIRMQGKYSECGVGFSKLAKQVGRYIAGKPLCLYYDGEYREEEANFEPCFPIRKEVSVEGVDVRMLPGGRCVTLVHQGPYDTLGRSYALAFDHAKLQGYEIELPTREVYLKGPGMIFRGNPKKYLTEIQLMIQE